jgi:hypothetical protein
MVEGSHKSRVYMKRQSIKHLGDSFDFPAPKFVVRRVQDSPEVVCCFYSKELAGKSSSWVGMDIKVIYSPKVDMGKMLYLAQV